MIYLDNAATAKPYLEGADFAGKFLTEYYNPSARYSCSRQTFKEINLARDAVLKSLNATFHHLIFTASGTEADNMALVQADVRKKIIVSAGEHSAVYEKAMSLKALGCNVVFCKIDRTGKIIEEDLLKGIDDNVGFVSIVHVNNETGTINDIVSLAKKIKAINPKIIFHSDGVQAYGKIPFCLPKEIDLYSVSAHKIGGIKGVGALFVNKNMNLKPLIFGGGQENGLRSGTENVYGIKFFEYAVKNTFSELEDKLERVKILRDIAKEKFQELSCKVVSGKESSPYILSVAFDGIMAEILQRLCDDEGVIIGTGSACSSKKPYSRVIKESGLENKFLNGVVRISFNSSQTKEEIESATDIIIKNVKKLKGKI